MINELRDIIHNNAKSKGFYDNLPVNIPEKIALIHSEVSEALEAERKAHYANIQDVATCFNILATKKDPQEFIEYFETTVKSTFEDEIADAIIRCLDLCGYMGIDIENHILLKMQYNNTRPYKHGKKF